MQIPPPYAGSLGALELIKGALDGVFVSRELKPSDVSGFSDAFGYPPTSVPISGGSFRQFGFLDATAFVVNKINPIDSLNFDQLDGILSTTHARGGKNLTKWGDVGVTGPLAAAEIKIYGITPWNGFEEFIRQKVLSYNGKRGECKST
jgi:phosphate transport system substrate-binding protein